MFVTNNIYKYIRICVCVEISTNVTLWATNSGESGGTGESGACQKYDELICLTGKNANLKFMEGEMKSSILDDVVNLALLLILTNLLINLLNRQKCKFKICGRWNEKLNFFLGDVVL